MYFSVARCRVIEPESVAKITAGIPQNIIAASTIKSSVFVLIFIGASGAL